jgi:hypothetical protein
MRIVEGRSGKSLEIVRILNQFDGKALLINASGLTCVHVFEKLDTMFFEDIEKMWESFNNNQEYDNFIQDVQTRSYRLVIFYTNDNEANLDGYGAIEDRLGIPIIVTIQKNDLETINIYEI